MIDDIREEMDVLKGIVDVYDEHSDFEEVPYSSIDLSASGLTKDKKQKVEEEIKQLAKTVKSLQSKGLVEVKNSSNFEFSLSKGDSNDKFDESVNFVITTRPTKKGFEKYKEFLSSENKNS